MAKKKAAAGINVDPPVGAAGLLVGNMYTAWVETEDDSVQFVGPSGRGIPAAKYQGKARATFLVERSGEVTVSFRSGGKAIAEQTFNTYTG